MDRDEMEGGQSSINKSLELRPPLLPLPASDGIKSAAAPDIRPLLNRMFVGSHVLRLGIETRFAALVLLHRYYDAVAASKSVNKCKDDNINTPGSLDNKDTKWIACACLFLACKAEEEHRRLRDAINLAQMFFSTPLDTDSSGTDIIHYFPTPPNLNEDYWEAKKTLVEMEQNVLRWLGFDVSVPHPYRAILLILRDADPQHERLDPDLQDDAFRWITDALFYAPALRHETVELAAASIELAKSRRLSSPDNDATLSKGWWKHYGVTDEGLAGTKLDLRMAAKSLIRCSTP